MVLQQNDRTTSDVISQINVVGSGLGITHREQKLGDVVTVQSRGLSRETTREIRQTNDGNIIVFVDLSRLN